MIRKWIAAGVDFVRGADVKEIGLIKLYLISLGALLGLAIPARNRKASALLAAVLFIGSFAAVLGRLLAHLTRVRDN